MSDSRRAKDFNAVRSAGSPPAKPKDKCAECGGYFEAPIHSSSLKSHRFVEEEAHMSSDAIEAYALFGVFCKEHQEQIGKMDGAADNCPLCTRDQVSAVNLKESERLRERVGELELELAKLKEHAIYRQKWANLALVLQSHGQHDCEWMFQELENCTKELTKRAEQAEAENAELSRIHDFWNAHSEWSQATFGTDAERGPIGPLRNLAKEVSEALAKPEDELEMADCFLLVCDAARRSGLTFDQLLRACWQKLEINKRRVWPKTTDMNAAVEHKRAAIEGK